MNNKVYFYGKGAEYIYNNSTIAVTTGCYITRKLGDYPRGTANH